MPPINSIFWGALCILISLCNHNFATGQTIFQSYGPSVGPTVETQQPGIFFSHPIEVVPGSSQPIQTVLPEALSPPTPQVPANGVEKIIKDSDEQNGLHLAGQIPLDDLPPIPRQTPETLSQLIELESKVQQLLPKIFPAVVSIEGGSGVVVRSDGVILTASHVTKKANRFVKVHFSNGRIAVARTLGTNTNTDTAALKLLDNGPWPHIPLGNSSTVEVGDWCVALGYPLSFRRGEAASVRVGRVLKVTDSRIVTDCTIMGGDSGGPLINMDGQVIAISSRVKTSLDQNVHVPIQAYLEDWTQLAASIDIRSPSKKAVVNNRAYLGILGETDNDRVRIRQVFQGSPAQSAGMMIKDVILELDGKPVSRFDDVLAMLETRKPGEQVQAKLNRFGNLIDVFVQLGSRNGVRQ